MKRIIFLSVLIAGVVAVALTGCNVTRTITTKSEYYRRSTDIPPIMARLTWTKKRAPALKVPEKKYNN